MGAIVWQTISIVGYSLAGVLLVVTVILFFKMNIPAIIGDLTGRTAAKQIQEIRLRNAMTGNKRQTPQAFHLERGLWTGRGGARTGRSGKFEIGKTGQALAHRSKLLDRSGQTEESSRPVFVENVVLNEQAKLLAGREISTALSEDTKVFFGKNIGSSATEVLVDKDVGASATEVLVDDTAVLDGTEVLMQDGATEVLSNDTVALDSGTVADETTVLNPTVELVNEEEPEIQPVEFKIVKDIKVIHTSEVI